MLSSCWVPLTQFSNVSLGIPLGYLPSDPVPTLWPHINRPKIKNVQAMCQPIHSSVLRGTTEACLFECCQCVGGMPSMIRHRQLFNLCSHSSIATRRWLTRWPARWHRVGSTPLRKTPSARRSIVKPRHKRSLARSISAS